MNGLKNDDRLCVFTSNISVLHTPYKILSRFTATTALHCVKRSHYTRSIPQAKELVINTYYTSCTSRLVPVLHVKSSCVNYTIAYLYTWIMASWPLLSHRKIYQYYGILKM